MSSADAPAPSPLPRQLAAVDLGSNSFHLIVAQVEGGELKVIDRMRETVRLAGGLDPVSKTLAEGDIERGLACLERFGQRLRGLPPGAVRAVGTNTLRSARNGEEFRRRAQSSLGHRIEVIAGREEARLIYLGVAHALGGDGRHHRLVVDIGGGSTELVIGEGFEPVYRESLYMGCVSMSKSLFGDGRITKERIAAAELAARYELEPIESTFRDAHWDTAIGCSGTIKAVAAVCRAHGWCGDLLTRDALARLRRALVDAGRVERLDLKVLKADRGPVLPGGLAVLSAVVDALGIDAMEVSELALREGVLYDLLGRIRHEDVRGRSVRVLMERYSVDIDHAARVERTALLCLRLVAPDWGLEPPRWKEALGWAARLHEVGLAVSHSQYHKHGAYLVQHADMAGFSRQEQSTLASLVRGHRRKFPLAELAALAGEDTEQVVRLCVLLRLAVALRRSRGTQPLPTLELRARGASLELRFPSGYLDLHPLTRAELERESRYLRDADVELRYA